MSASVAGQFPDNRMRRSRRTPALRRLVAETTLSSADFDFLEQESVKFLARHPLEALAARCHSGEGVRSLVSIPEMDWTTSTVPLAIRRDW